MYAESFATNTLRLLLVFFGLVEFRLGLKMIFVFNEADASDPRMWTAMLCGPLALLPCAILALFRKALAIQMLVLCALLSSVAFYLTATLDQFFDFVVSTVLVNLVMAASLNDAKFGINENPTRGQD
jgi:hypothetical protein